jgi:hypothetical protein
LTFARRSPKSLLFLAESMGVMVSEGVRFSITQLRDGPWLVVDDRNRKRLVASCPEENAARAIAAFINGDVDAAVTFQKQLVVRLDSLIGG